MDTLNAELFRALVVSSVLTITIVFVLFYFRPRFREQADSREKGRAQLKEQIKKKLQKGIRLEAHEISLIGAGLHLSYIQSIIALHELYSEAEDQAEHAYLKGLLAEIKRVAPFESFPEEVRPSLARLSQICQETSMESDQQLLHPLTKVLSEYQDMKRDHAAIKKQSRISYGIAVVSFFIGIVGLVLAFSGPSKDFISEEIKKSTSSIQEQLREAQQ